MQTTTAAKVAPLKPIQPVRPWKLNDLILRNNDLVREGRAFAKEWGWATAYDLIGSEVADVRRAIERWWAAEEGQAYAAECREYEAAAGAWNAYVKAERQARINRREVTKVNAARCPRCTASHAGEC